jgi:hypothetical protein
MHYFSYFVTIRLEIGDMALGSGVFDEVRSMELLWYNHV